MYGEGGYVFKFDEEQKLKDSDFDLSMAEFLE